MIVQDRSHWQQSYNITYPQVANLFFDTLLQVLYQVVASGGPLVVSVVASPYHKVSSLTLAHLRMESLPEISYGIAPAEAG